LKIITLECIRFISEISTKFYDAKQINVYVILYEGDDSTNFTARTSGNLISLEWRIFFLLRITGYVQDRSNDLT
jgi:hypothetical protein